ncbi:hypothetical protein MNEG_12305 [Monoraphidium neglectum]|uniref:Uncharacterized protein n=1 Tax=Monoraphidium neglectum TaxID=145388 RepID=A0A0D2M2Y1_9CHLO|nr:hypothetical protein MNEG_12305 [Monoraphidium neglectum]KIY95656.1 hypothetical protein MNEG_12305 [Monoraphidium neglectum]|eukprot:XP_013894676.1 hypothetical protein MNEG_12305 [Monoraphidium neglectum]
MADQSSVARLIEELTTPDGYGRHIDGIVDDELGQRLATLKSMLKFDATLVAHAHAVLFERLAAPEVEPASDWRRATGSRVPC